MNVFRKEMLEAKRRSRAEQSSAFLHRFAEDPFHGCTLLNGFQHWRVLEQAPATIFESVRRKPQIVLVFRLETNIGI